MVMDPASIDGTLIGQEREKLELAALVVAGRILSGAVKRKDAWLLHLQLQTAKLFLAPRQRHEVTSSQPFIVVRQGDSP